MAQTAHLPVMRKDRTPSRQLGDALRAAANAAGVPFASGLKVAGEDGRPTLQFLSLLEALGADVTPLRGYPVRTGENRPTRPLRAALDKIL